MLLVDGLLLLLRHSVLLLLVRLLRMLYLLLVIGPNVDIGSLIIQVLQILLHCHLRLYHWPGRWSSSLRRLCPLDKYSLITVDPTCRRSKII